MDIDTPEHPQKSPSPPNRYVSDFERFMDDYLAAHPEVEQDRRRGWGIWWERFVDLKELERMQADAVPRPPYSYD